MADETVTTVETKPWYLSTTFIGLAITLGGVVLGWFGLDIDETTQEELKGSLPNVIETVLEFGGLIIAGWGRVKATKKITS